MDDIGNDFKILGDCMLIPTNSRHGLETLFIGDCKIGNYSKMLGT